MSENNRTIVTRTWPFAGGDVHDIGRSGTFVEEEWAPPGPDEVIARVDAVCICSSDIKVIRMGAAHPLFAERDLAAEPAVLGHEMALTVLEVGSNWRDRFKPGDRLGLQPAIMVEGRRRTIGMDLPGAFGQHIRLDSQVLGGEEPYVFPVPADVSAATVAMLEPYSCVEAAYRPNCRTNLMPKGRLLLVSGEGAGAIELDVPRAADEVVLVAPDLRAREWAGPAARESSLDLLRPDDPPFDDIIVRGRVDAQMLGHLFTLLAKGGLFVLAGEQVQDPVAVDAARIHYQALSIVGTRGPSLSEAFSPSRTGFKLRPGGVMLILGAGGAMGRIHTHRALEMKDGPATIIATSRKASRCQALHDDFAALAERKGKRLVVVEDQVASAAVRDVAPDGCDDVVVVAPDIELIERAASFMAPDGMLVLFSGMPFGKPCHLPIGRIATHGARITGSTGSTVADQLAVLDRVTDGTLDLAGNLEAVGGLRVLPEALQAVTEGRVTGKIAIYPWAIDLPLSPIRELKKGAKDMSWTREDEERLLGR